MPLPAIATALISAAPSIIGLFTGDDEEDKSTAQEVAEVAKSIAGVSSEDEAAKVINQDPELALKFRESVNEMRVKKMEFEFKRLQSINETMRLEYRTGGWKSGWRPYFGYVFTTAYGAIFFGALYLIWDAMQESLDQAIQFIGELPTLVTAVTPLLGIGLAVLGVSIRERGKDKRAGIEAVNPKKNRGLIGTVKDWISGKESKKE